jgi:hypothetical protein
VIPRARERRSPLQIEVARCSIDVVVVLVVQDVVDSSLHSGVEVVRVLARIRDTIRSIVVVGWLKDESKKTHNNVAGLVGVEFFSCLKV